MRQHLFAFFMFAACFLANANASLFDPEAELKVDVAMLTPPQRPTEVGIAVYLSGLSKISEPKEPFPYIITELFLDVQWHDPRLAFDAKAMGTTKKTFQANQVDTVLNHMWWPDIEFENEEGNRLTENRELIILADGSVEYMERMQVRLHSEVNLRKFPFDSQVFEVIVGSFSWNSNNLVFKPIDSKIGYNADHHTLEWDIDRIDYHIDLKTEVRSITPFSEFVLEIYATRKPGFYVWKLVVPLLIIASLSWTTFWMSGEPAPSRLQRVFIVLLSVVAFHRVVADSLPRIPYLTFMDGVVYLVFLLTGLTLMSIIATHTLTRNGREAAGARLDTFGRWAFPVIGTVGYGALWALAHLD